MPCETPTAEPTAAPTENSNTVISFTSANLYPESIGWNQYTQRYILGSAGQGGVYEVDKSGAVTLVGSPNVTGLGKI